MMKTKVDFSQFQRSILTKIKDSEKGQSTIEFLIGFSVMFMLILLLAKVALQFTNGYFLHYATYMASRTYMVVDVNANDESSNDQFAERRAKAVFERFNVPLLIPNFDGSITFQSPDAVAPVFSGAYAEFKEKFSPIAVFGGDTEINFRSESFLRREPGRITCLEQICKAMEELGQNCQKNHITFYDNGC